MSRSENGGVLITACVVLTLIVAIPIFVIAFYQLRKAHWDAQIQEMCSKDGGVKVYQKVSLNEEEYRRLGGIQGQLPIPSVDDARRSSYPYFLELREIRIRDWNPEVIRLEMTIKRRSDGAILGMSVSYLRRGGDIPSGLFNDSSFSCPRHIDLERQIFTVSRSVR